MRKQWLSALLAVLMLFSLSPLALAAESRDTNFFEPREHADLDFSQMKYEAVDTDEILAQMDQVRALAADKANTEKVVEGFEAACDQLEHAATMQALADIAASRDMENEAAVNDQVTSDRAFMEVHDGLFQLARDILASPCADVMDAYVAEEARDALIAYTSMSDELLDLFDEDTRLNNAYWLAYAEDYPAEAGGQTWNSVDEAMAAVEKEGWDAEKTQEILTALEQKRNEVLGKIYLQMIENRKAMAKASGYDRVVDFYYEQYYARDYTPEEIQTFVKAVKTEIVPIYAELEEVLQSEENREAFRKTYSAEEILDTIAPYLARMSDELLESYSYLRAHKLYDLEDRANKYDQNYTIGIPAYGSAFLFHSPTNSAFDFSAAIIHEFGHFNQTYWNTPGWDQSEKGVDIMEVHSQGLEVLFSHFYPEIFGEDAPAMQDYLLSNMLNVIITGSLYEELQQYTYAAENVTLDQINREYCRLCREYGLIDKEDPREALYGWVETPHTFVSPFYYLSYAVSAAGAFTFWQETDFNAAVDSYLRFTALDLAYTFQESFEEVGLKSPLSADYVKELAQSVRKTLDSREMAGSFRDVKEDSLDAAEYVRQAGLMDFPDPAAFEPEKPFTRGESALALWRLDGRAESKAAPFSDVSADRNDAAAIAWAAETGVAAGYAGGTFRPDSPITRQQLAVMLYRYAKTQGQGFTGMWAFPLRYPDAEAVGEYAYEAMCWMTMNGVVEAQADGALHPGEALSRAEAARMLLNFSKALTPEEADAA